MDDQDEPELSPTQAAYGDPRAVAIAFVVPSELDGARADFVLTWKVRRLSRTRAQDIIRRGDFRDRERGALKASTRLPAGSAVHLWRIPPDEAAPLARAPTVVFEDEDLLVVDKPGDLAVHPSARYLHQTLTRWLATRDEDGPRAHPCHRLDRETSGVLVCAKTREAERRTKTAFQEGRVEKTYLAVVRGALAHAARIDRPLALQGERGLVRIRMIEDPLGLPSVTRVVPLVVDHARARTLVACFPETGRQHQIRAHLALHGFPLVGDKLYAMGDAYFDALSRTGAPVDDDRLDHVRHALHAYALVLDDGRRFVAPFPAELAALIGDGFDAGALDARVRAAASSSS